MFSKAQLSQIVQLLGYRGLSIVKYNIYSDFEGSPNQNTEFINVSNGLAEHI